MKRKAEKAKESFPRMRKPECIAFEIKGTFVALFSSIHPSPDNGGRELVLSFSRAVRPSGMSTVFIFPLALRIYN